MPLTTYTPVSRLRSKPAEPAAPAPAFKPAPEPPPLPPSAPALPFRFVGKFAEDGALRLLLVNGDKEHHIAGGETLEGTYYVERIAVDAVVFTATPHRDREAEIQESWRDLLSELSSRDLYHRAFPLLLQWSMRGSESRDAEALARLAEDVQASPSIVLFRQREAKPGAMAKLLLSLLPLFCEDLAAGAMVVIRDDQTLLRKFPRAAG